MKHQYFTCQVLKQIDNPVAITIILDRADVTRMIFLYGGDADAELRVLDDGNRVGVRRNTSAEPPLPLDGAECWLTAMNIYEDRRVY